MRTPSTCRGAGPFAVFLFAALLVRPAGAQWVTTRDPVFQGDLAQPPAGGTVVDPHFHSTIRRITDARAAGVPGIVPQYAKRQAWNANDSLLLLFSGDGRALLHDARTYAFLRELPVGGEDVFWHPLHPAVIVSTDGTTVFSYDIAADRRTDLLDFPEFSWINTRGEGNLSRDGRWYAFVGQTYDSTVHFREIVVCDLDARAVHARMPLPDSLADFDWVSVSPLGDHVVVDYATTLTGRFNGVEVYDRDLRFQWQKPLGSGHSDIAVDPSGREKLVMGYYDDQTNTSSVRAWDLAGGGETVLVEYDWSIYTHVSCRNIARPEWCFISTYDGEGRLTDDSASWLPFEDEIFAARIDGGGVQRIAHHRSRRFSPTTPDSDNSVYWAEPHATVNAAGTRVLFGSNWRLRVESDSSVDAYVADFGSLVRAEAVPAPAAPGMDLWPNPVSAGAGTVTLKLGAPLPSGGVLAVHDPLGRLIRSRRIAPTRSDFILRLQTAGMTPGRYLVSVGGAGGAQSILLTVLP